MAHIIVLGNEKGGSGKSTTALHVISALIRSGYRVGALDLDLRQKSLFRFLDNRQSFIDRKGVNLPMPMRLDLLQSKSDSQIAAREDEEERYSNALTTLKSECEFIVIDCPGAHTRFSQMAHASADTLITPMNDSLVDFDLLAVLDPADGKVLGPSIYSEMVWKARQVRASEGRKPIDWIVLRNRLSSIDAKNKRRVGAALTDLASRIGFRIAPGFTERVVFRELFLSGLTLLDLKDSDTHKLTMSVLAARQEVRDLIKSLNLDGVEVGF